MSESINDQRKKRGRPATGMDPMMGLRMPPHVTAALDAAAAADPDKPTRSALVRKVLVAWLKRRGFL